MLITQVKECFGISFPFGNLNWGQKIIQNTFNDMISIVFPGVKMKRGYGPTDE